MCKPENQNHLTLRKNGQLSNIACLIVRDVFAKYKFRTNYAEELDLGLRLIRDEYKLAFLSSTKVIHSHNRAAYYHLKRGYVDDLFLSQIVPGRPIVAIEIERLYRDIVFVQELLNSIVCKELEGATVPCSVKKVASIIMDTFNNAGKANYPIKAKIANNGYLDREFRVFLESIHEHHYGNGKKDLPYDGILLDAMRNITMMIFEYMSHSYELIDAKVLEDFKTSLYKAYAFMCGTHLACCFIQGSDGTKETMTDIHHELTQGV
jgi:hypothetical protein